MNPASISPTAAPSAWRVDLQRCVLALLPVLAWDASGLDRVVMEAIGGAHGFALRDHVFVSAVLHRGGRALGWLVFALMLLSLWRPLPGLRSLGRRELLASLMICLASVALVGLVKQHSLTSCPWSLAEFGGTARYVSHWTLGVADGAGGGCFPSGHASTAFSFLTLAFALRDTRPVLAHRVALSIVLLGTLFGAAQTLRGAHYPSHTLWTAWICLALTSALHALPSRSRRRR